MGSEWTYASPSDGTAAAPGQLDPALLEQRYRFSEIGADTPLYGVTGNPLSHTRSPEIHNQWLQAAGLPGTYLAFRADDLAPLLEVADMWGVTGLSVTVPHKHRALELAEYSDVSARSIGAANTLHRGGDGWRGRNTDAAGFLEPLEKIFPHGSLAGTGVTVIGAGGAARAAVHALAVAGARMVILNRTVSKARELAATVGAEAAPLAPESASKVRGRSTLVVQTTVVGMKGRENEDPAPWLDLSDTQLVYDMVYEPAETVLLKRARIAGCATINGEGMLRAQAAEQFRIFTGIDAPRPQVSED
jgi:3-dehydroquinate dehydratase/shikimate dehydrogenase